MSKTTTSATSRTEYPSKSGIYIMEVPNISGGRKWGTSFRVTVPARLTGKDRLRRNHPTLEAARSWAADQLRTGRKLGAGFHGLTEDEQRKCMEALEILRPKGLDIVAAARFASERLASEVSTVPSEQVIKELIESRAKKSDRYREDLRLRLKRFSDQFPSPLAHRTGKEMTAWIKGLDVAPQTQLNFKRVVVTVFEFAKEQEYLPAGFDEHSKIVVDDLDGEGEILIFTPDEVAKLLDAAAPAFKPCLAIQCFAGMRSSELERLTWDAIDMSERKIVFTKARKGKRTKRGGRVRRTIPIGDRLAAILAPYVDAGAAGVLWGGNDDAYSDEQTSAADAAEVPWKKNAPRHSYGSYRMEITKNENLVALEMGNTPDMVIEHYREVVSKKAALAWFGITEANLDGLAGTLPRT